MATTPQKFAPIIHKNKVHRPAVATEFIDSNFIQISRRAGNTLQATEDGLYSGHNGAGRTVYVSAAGVDAPTSGSRDVPFKTLDYCLENIAATDPLVADNLVSNYVRVALKCGEQFECNSTLYVIGCVILTFYGDPNYGDFDSPLVGGIAWPSVMSDLLRPIIAVKHVAVSNGVIITGFRMELAGTVSLQGVRIDLPGDLHNVPGVPVPSSFGDYSDFVTAIGNSSGQLELIGAIINRTSLTGPFGIFGVHARCADARITQFASQFWYNGAPITAASPPEVLASRQYFIKFYKDYFGNRQSNGFLNLGSTGSGLMSLTWSQSEAGTVIPGKTNLATYPIVEDQNQGLGNYIMNLTRDAQGRALNVRCGLKL